LVSQLREDLLLCSSYLPLGVPNGLYLQAIKQFSSAVAGEEEDFCKGSLARTIFYFVFSFALFYFFLHLFIKNTKKLVSFIVVFIYLLLVLLE
jgi:cell division protein FtsW (lipid II flippase)